MPHIESIGLSNYRRFKNYQKFDLAPITILLGPNNSGKSTVLNSLRILNKAFKKFGHEIGINNGKWNFEELFQADFDTPEVKEKFGSLWQSKSAHSESKKVVFSLKHKAFKIPGYNDVIFNIGFDNSELRNPQLQEIFVINDKKVLFGIQKESTLAGDFFYANINFILGLIEYRKTIERSFLLKQRLDELNHFCLGIEDFQNSKEILDLVKNINIDFNVTLTAEIIGKRISYEVDNQSNIDSILNLNFLNESNKFNPKLDGVLFNYELLFELFKGIKRFDIIQAEQSASNDFKSVEDRIVNFLSKISFNYDSYLNYLKLSNSNYFDFSFFLYFIDGNSIYDKILYDNNIDNYPSYLYYDDFLEFSFDKRLSLNEYVEDFWDLHYFLISQRCNQIFEGELESDLDFFKAFFCSLSVLKYYQKYFGENAEFDFIKKRKSEIHFFKYFLNNNVDSIYKSIKPLSSIEYIGLNRIQNKRINLSTDDSGLIKHTKSLFYKKAETESGLYEICKKFIDDWLYKFDLGFELDIQYDQKRDIFSHQIRTFDDKEFSLSDNGSGASQIVSILLSIADIYYNHDPSSSSFNPTTILLEEPEANLHPKLQSLLADLILESSKMFNIQFVIETHSDLFIKKFQLLMAQGSQKRDRLKKVEFNDLILNWSKYQKLENEIINVDMLSIYYFDAITKENLKLESNIISIRIGPDGSLTNEIPEDFYDVALNLKFELLKLANSQKN